MKQREAMAGYVASKRTPRVRLPRNGLCPNSAGPLYWFDCRCDNHRCGECGRRRSQRPSPTAPCPCKANRIANLSPNPVDVAWEERAHAPRSRVT